MLCALPLPPLLPPPLLALPLPQMLAPPLLPPLPLPPLSPPLPTSALFLLLLLRALAKRGDSCACSLTHSKAA
jgi:hypothetical protein